MEQTSFLFQQASKVGFSHSRILRTIVQHACSRFPSLVPCNNAWTALFRKMQSAKQAEAIQKGTSKQKVFVIFGGDTSERQVSLMSGSGTNVWLNLQGFDVLDVIPCLLTPANGYSSSHNQDFSESSHDVWTLPPAIRKHSVVHFPWKSHQEEAIQLEKPQWLRILSLFHPRFLVIKLKRLLDCAKR